MDGKTITGSESKSLFAEFIQKPDGEIYLTNADTTFVHLCRCEMDDIGQNIQKLMTKGNRELLYHYYAHYREGRSQFYFIMNFPEYDNIFWGIDAIIDFPKMQIRGNRLVTEAEPALTGGPALSETMLHTYLIGCGLLRISESGSIYFEDINDFLSLLIEAGKVRRSDILHSYIFNRCIESKQIYVGRATMAAGDPYIFGAYPIIFDGTVKEIEIFLIPSGSTQIINESVMKQLTPRECRVLQMTGEGLSIGRIAELLHISVSTAKTILYGSYQKIHVRTTTEAILKLYGLNGE